VENEFQFCSECKVFETKPSQHITLYHSAYFQAWMWLHNVMGMLAIVTDWGVFQDRNKHYTDKHRKTWFSLFNTRRWEINSPFSITRT
jgi:hypothetical protein